MKETQRTERSVIFLVQKNGIGELTDSHLLQIPVVQNRLSQNKNYIRTNHLRVLKK